jgi:hypothetical protein
MKFLFLLQAVLNHIVYQSVFDINFLFLGFVATRRINKIKIVWNIRYITSTIYIFSSLCVICSLWDNLCDASFTFISVQYIRIKRSFIYITLSIYVHTHVEDMIAIWWVRVYVPFPTSTKMPFKCKMSNSRLLS